MYEASTNMKKKLILIGLLATCLLTGCNESKSDKTQSIENLSTTEQSTLQSIIDSTYNDKTGNDPYVDKDIIEFYYKEAKVILGKTPVSDLLDEGAEFYTRNDELLDIKNKTLSPDGFISCSLVISDGGTQSDVTIYNTSDKEQLIKDCTLVSIIVCPEYIKGNKYIYFNFPMDITLDEFIAKAGEPHRKDTRKNNTVINYNKHDDREYGKFTLHFQDDKLSIISLSDKDY